MLSNTVIFTGNANPVLAREIASDLGIELGKAAVGHFSDGEVTIEIQRTCVHVTCSWCSRPAPRPTST